MPLLWDLFSLFPAHAGVIPYALRQYAKLSLFPAHAGVILQLFTNRCRRGPFPRPRGGDPRHGFELAAVLAFSPPTRG